MTGIRGRVVVWYVSLLALLLLGLCVVQTVTLTGYLLSSSTQSMEQVAAGGLTLARTCSLQAPSQLRHRAATIARLLGSDGVSAAVLTPDGRILARSPAPRPAPAPPTAAPAAVRRFLASAPRATPQIGPAAAACAAPAATSRREGETLYLALPLGPAGHVMGYAVLARSLAAEDATLRRVRLTLILGALAVLFLAAAGALPVLRRALRPLQRVTAAAEAIAAGDLTRRAHLPGSGDEIARLGQAFDTMVDRLQAALSASTASEGRMRRFVADASHELRTPLTVLRGSSQLLLRHHELDGEETAVTVRAIHDEAERLSRLVDDLLTLSTLDAGVRLDPRPVPVGPFLRDFVRRYAAAWPDRRLELRAGELTGSWVSVDPEAFRRVLTNLLDNAARYSLPGAPITIGGRAEAGTVAVLVQDEGPGLSAEDAAHVFERFYRGNKSRARSSGGAGLGLAIVQALVEGSKGEIRIDTGRERGTTVTVRLPAAPAPTPSDSSARPADRPRTLVELAGRTS